ncbi:MAG: hypothetical protein WC966_11555 [Bradymonadales bacterium]|jgi:antitoxin component YwqK of YwqJK toxin-antitoxin module
MAKDGVGTYEYYFTNGQKQFEIAFQKGVLHGVMRRWNMEGQLILEQNYAHDVLEGRSKRWFDNGLPREDAFYIDNKLHGEYVQYTEDGKIAMRAKFKDGQIVQDSVRS